MSTQSLAKILNAKDGEKILFNPSATIDLGIRKFKQYINENIREGRVAKTYKNSLIKQFKRRGWEQYHEAFPYDNSSHPTHNHKAIDNLDLL